MKKIILSFVAIFTGLISANSYATNGIYLTAESGWAEQTGLPDKDAPGFDQDAYKIDTQQFLSAYRGSVGYNHDFCFYPKLGFGLNIGYGRYGKATYYFPNGNSSIYSTALEFLGVITYHIYNFDIFGKGGGIRQTIHVNGVDTQPVQTRIHPEFAIGGAYNFTPHWAMTLTYARVLGQKSHNLDTAANQAPGLNEVLLGLRYTFC